SMSSPKLVGTTVQLPFSERAEPGCPGPAAASPTGAPPTIAPSLPAPAASTGGASDAQNGVWPHAPGRGESRLVTSPGAPSIVSVTSERSHEKVAPAQRCPGATSTSSGRPGVPVAGGVGAEPSGSLRTGPAIVWTTMPPVASKASGLKRGARSRPLGRG